MPRPGPQDREYSGDDRGQPLRSGSARELLALVSRLDAAPASVLERFRHRQRYAVRNRPFLPALGENLLALVGILVSLAALSMLVTWARTPLVMVVGIVAVIGAAHFLSVRLTRRRLHGELARTLAAHGLCGGCTYPMDGIPPAADGCQVCPECGAAWKQSRRLPTSINAWDALWQRAGAGSINVVTDDRGLITYIVDTSLRPLSPARREALGPEVLKSLRNRLRGTGRTKRWIAFCVFETFILGVTIYAAWHTQSIVVPAWIMGFCLLVGVAVLSSDAFIRPRDVRASLLAVRRCPSCLHDLAGAAPGGDGVVVCGSCGSGWCPDAS